MSSTAHPPHFVSLRRLERVGRLVCAGREVPARQGGGRSVDGLWRETGRADGGVLVLLLDVEGKGSGSTLLRELIEQVLDNPRTWDRQPGDLLCELHSLAGALWAETERTFVAGAVLVPAQADHFLLACAGLPLPFYAPAGQPWRTLKAPSEGIGLLGRPDLHAEGEPVFPDLRVDLRPRDRFLAVTDGITEAGRPSVLGAAAVLSLLDRQPADGSPDELLRAVFNLAAARDGPRWPGDDATGFAWRLEDRPST